MIQELKYKTVNWVDGMKISQKHFLACENHVTDSLRDVASYSIHQNNFGLLPAGGENSEDVFDVFNSATNDVQLIIRRCHAITPAGYRIAIENMTVNVNTLTANGNQQDGNTQSYYILIAVNPFERVPQGEFDPEETPPRHLYTQPKYHVELVPADTVYNEFQGGNYIVAGRVRYEGGIIRADADFIPPCASVSSSKTLLRYYNEFARLIAGLQQFSLRIVQKNHNRSQNAPLTKSIRELCIVMLNSFSNCYFSYRNMIHLQPPVHMVEVFARLAHSVYNAIELMPDHEKEEALNYCYEWSDVAPHQLLNQLSTVTEIKYDHYKTGEYMKQISLLLNSLYNTWEKLSGLEYIGQHKENIIVKEEAIAQVVKSKKGWSILD
ncbi:hypothetical protein ACTHGU_09025 [Chitinophagaceae bacterium MMS25-I14]